MEEGRSQTSQVPTSWGQGRERRGEDREVESSVGQGRGGMGIQSELSLPAYALWPSWDSRWASFYGGGAPSAGSPPQSPHLVSGLVFDSTAFPWLDEICRGEGEGMDLGEQNRAEWDLPRSEDSDAARDGAAAVSRQPGVWPQCPSASPMPVATVGPLQS